MIKICCQIVKSWAQRSCTFLSLLLNWLSNRALLGLKMKFYFQILTKSFSILVFYWKNYHIPMHEEEWCFFIESHSIYPTCSPLLASKSIRKGTSPSHLSKMVCPPVRCSITPSLRCVLGASCAVYPALLNNFVHHQWNMYGCLIICITFQCIILVDLSSNFIIPPQYLN